MSLLKRLKSQIGYGGGGSLHHTTLFRSKSLEGVPVSHILDDPHFTITAGRDMILEFVNSQEVPWSPKEDCVFTIIEFLYSFSPKMIPPFTHAARAAPIERMGPKVTPDTGLSVIVGVEGRRISVVSRLMIHPDRL